MPEVRASDSEALKVCWVEIWVCRDPTAVDAVMMPAIAACTAAPISARSDAEVPTTLSVRMLSWIVSVVGLLPEPDPDDVCSTSPPVMGSK